MDALAATLDAPQFSLRAALFAAADAADPASAGVRQQALALIKATLVAVRESIRCAFESGENVHDTMAAHAEATDGVIRDLLEFTVEAVFPAPNPTTGDRICLVAVGGYGRGELAPFSDIDLLFLLPYKKTPRSEQIVEYVLYMLWDTGLKVGHATRTVDECIRLARQDVTICTSLLEQRLLWGESSLHEALRRRYLADVVQGSEMAFVEAKLAERDDRHQRMGDSRYVVEPNVKEGKGGLRDLHTLYWIVKYLYRVDRVSSLVPNVFTRSEMRRLKRADELLNTVRCHLHNIANRAEERLTFDVQVELGSRMGYTDHAGSRGVERFMKHYYLTAKEVGNLTRILCAALEADHRRKPRFSFAKFWPRRGISGAFVTEGGRLDIKDPAVVDEDPIILLRLFQVAQQHEIDIHPHALRLVARKLSLIGPALREDPEANRLFIEMLTSPKDPETTMRRLSEAGVLGRFIPAFGRIVAQMQYDMYHTYTVDEHTIRAIGNLRAIEDGLLGDEAPVVTDVVHKLLSRRALYVAVFMHDIAKGRGGDHSILGAEIAETLCPRLGLDAAETETVSWLVRYHLNMSGTAFKRDLNDPQTVQDFASLVQSPERLRLLLVLTVADIKAVGPEIWNSWKATLLRQLYYKADEVLSGGSGTGIQAAWVVAAQEQARIALSDWSDAAFAEYANTVPPAYWLSFDSETLARQARLARRAAEMSDPLFVEARVDPARGVTEVTVCATDHAGLFSRITGAIAIAGANIVDARIFTLQNGIALDTFWVQDSDSGAFAGPESLKRLETRIREVLSGAINLHAELGRGPSWPSRTSVFTVTPQVLIDNRASAAHTVIEVNGRDRVGLLYDVTRALTQVGLQIATARVSTYGENAVDVFYVKDVFGLKAEHENKLKQVKIALQKALADPAKPEDRSTERPRKRSARPREKAKA